MFAVASIICVNTSNFEVLITARILQGIGLASPRTLSIAMIRDSYEGDYMAKVMSFIVMIFILIPIIAPTMGQFLMFKYNWQSIFNVQLGIGILVILWFWKRQPETLAINNRIPFRSTTLFSRLRLIAKLAPILKFLGKACAWWYKCITGLLNTYFKGP